MPHKKLLYKFTEEFVTPFLHYTASLFAVFKAPLTILLTVGFQWLVIEYLPAPMAVFWLVVATLLDLWTGLLKAWATKRCSTSIGFRRTLIKIGSYTAIVVFVTAFVNILGIVDQNKQYNLSILINALMGLMIFVELFSVLENISLAYPRSPMVRMFVKPMMKILRGRFIKNPLDNETTN